MSEFSLAGAQSGTWDVAESILRSDHPDCVARLLFAEARRYGFTAGALGAVTPVLGTEGASFFYSDWPREWLRLYKERDFASRDVAVQAAKLALHPFRCSELSRRVELSRDSREVLEEGRSFGWRDALVIPMHGPTGYLAIAVLAGEETSIDPIGRAKLQLLAHLSHERCGTLLSKPVRHPALTPRETECLRWVAAGKTDWEIGEILSISHATAHFHVENAKSKLGCHTRAQAAVKLAATW